MLEAENRPPGYKTNLFLCREPYGERGGGEGAAGVGFALPGDIEGGAVIYGGADDGEAEGGIHGGIEGEGFQGDVALVVIHADEGVGGFSTCGEETGIGREGAFDFYSGVGGSGAFDGGNDGGFFFAVSEEAVFSGVGIESADYYLWRAAF